MAEKDRMVELFDELVPTTGKADTVAGELVRAYTRLEYRYYNDGDIIGRDYGNETCNAPARFLQEKCKPAAPVIESMWGEMWDHAYKDKLHKLKEVVLQYIDSNEELREAPNTTAIYEFTQPEDYDYRYEEDEDYY